MRYEKYKGGNHWAVYDDDNELICLTVYKRGAIEVIKRLNKLIIFKEENICQQM